MFPTGIRKALLLLPIIGLLYPGCKKDSGSSSSVREAYTIEGTVQDRGSATPIVGVEIKVTASDRTGSTVVSQDGGSTTTDAAGHFSIAPYHYNVVTTYDLILTRDGYYDERSAIPANYFTGAGHPTSYTLLLTMLKK